MKKLLCVIAMAAVMAMAGDFRFLSADFSGIRGIEKKCPDSVSAAPSLTQANAIDPLVIACSSFLGGVNSDQVRAMAVDSAGAVYVAGHTYSGDFPVVRGLQSRYGGAKDIFVCKLSSNGRQLIFSTYIGGSGREELGGMCLDSQGNICVCGTTESPDFPRKGPLQARGRKKNIFVLKMSGAGDRLVFCSVIGGSGDDFGKSLCVTPADAMCVTGETFSADFPVIRAIQPFKSGGSDVFVAVIASGGQTLDFSTFLGGKGNESGNAIGRGPEGDLHVTGITWSDDFPLMQALQNQKSGEGDVFVLRLKHGDPKLVYSTFLGGGSIDRGNGIFVSHSSSVWVCGTTRSADFPVVSGFRNVYGGGFTDVFLTRLSPLGETLEYSSFLGGSRSDDGFAVYEDVFGYVYVTGNTDSRDFPVAKPVQMFNGTENTDIFMTRFRPGARSVDFSTFLGGSLNENSRSMAVDMTGSVYLAGHTYSADFPVQNAFNSSFSSSQGTDGIFMKLITPNPVISGRILDEYHSPLAGVAVTFSNNAGSVRTDTGGYYIFSVAAGWKGRVKPEHQYYSFSPSFRDLAAVNKNQGNQDFLASVPLDLNLSARIMAERSWLQKKNYVEIILTATNPQNVPIAGFVISRSVGGEEFKIFKEFPASELIQGKVALMDTEKDLIGPIRYRAEAMDAGGRVIKRSFSNQI